MRCLQLTRIIDLAALSLLGPSSINTALAAPPAVDPCKLLTHAEIEQVIGKLKGGPVGESIGNAVTYTYEFADGKGAFEI